LKPWMILPLAGQPQEMRPASDARVGVGGAVGSTGLTGMGVAVAGGVSGADPALPDRRRVWPTRSWLGSVMLFRRARVGTSMPWRCAIWYSVSPGLTT